MELSRFTDYSLRVLIYAAAREGQKVTLAELTRAYRISQHHLVKIVHYLGKEGFLRNQRGRTGGILLGREPGEIRVGDVVRSTETHTDLVECFNPANDTCRLTPACKLKGVLQEARAAFFSVLDSYTLDDLVRARGPGIIRLLATAV